MAEQIKGRIERLEGQIHNLERAMVYYPVGSRPWLMRRAAIDRLKADIATLNTMLEALPHD